MRKVFFRLAGMSICISFLLLQQTSASSAANKKDGVINAANTIHAIKTNMGSEESEYNIAINMDYIYHNDIHDLINLSDMIVTGEAEMISSELQNGIPYGKYHIKIEHVYKGEPTEDIILDKVIKEYGNRTVMNEIPIILRDTTYLFTLKNDSPGFQMHNPSQGCYEMDNDETQQMLASLKEQEKTSP